jgi:hypothetical protein
MMTKKQNEISSVTVPIDHYKLNNVISEEVVFNITREDDRIKAIPLLSKEALLSTGLPEKLEFVYSNYCIVAANNMEEETLNAIKQIILELEVQDYFD